MELLTKKYVYQIVGESTVGSNECIIKSEALSLASKNRKNVTSDLSAYSSNEYIDKFEVEDMPDLRKFKFAKTAFQFGEAGGNGTSAVVSTDIDGNDIAFTALANVDWVNVTKAKDNTVEFTVNSNTGNMRSAKITGTNSTGFTDTISIQQDAYTPQYSHTYTLRINGAASQPTKVVINNQEVTPVKQDSSYVCTYTYRSSNTDDAPSKVSYSIAGGLKAQEVISTDSSVSPLSWNLDNGLTKSFAVSVVNTVRSYSWDYQSGVDNFINIDSEDVVEMKSADSTQSTSASYTVNPPTGVTVTKNGMNFTATASSTSSTGIMQVVVNGKAYNIKVTYDPAIVLKTYTYTLKATGASSAPKMTINNQSITPTYASGVYTGVYSTTCPEGSQPSTVTWSISDGVPSTDWGQYYISTSPSSWSVTGAGSKDFSVSISQDKTEYSWSATSGTIAYNDSVSCRIVSEDGTWTPSSDNIKVSVDSPSWVSTSMSGKTLTATTDGSETSDRSGNIRLTTAYSDGTQGTCYISVNYTAPTIEEVWPDWNDSSVVYTFGFGSRGASSPSTTSISGNFAADGTEKNGNTYGKYSVISYKTRTSNLGNTEDKPVNYKGEIGKPSANTSTSSLSGSGTITQDESGKTITWSWTQDGVEETWPDWNGSSVVYTFKSSVALDFTFSYDCHSVDYVNYTIRSYKTRTSNLGNTEDLPVNYTGGPVWTPSSNNTSEEAIVKTGTFTQDESGKTIPWTVTQEGKPHETVTTGPYYDNFSATSINFSYTGGSKTITCTKYYLVDGVRSNETTESKTITCSENTSTSSKSWTETFNGQTINCTQDGKPDEEILGPFYTLTTSGPISFTAAGGTKTVNYKEYYTQGGSTYSSENKSTTVSVDALYSTSSRSGSLSVGDTGLTIGYTQSANSRSANSSATHSPNTMTWKGGDVSYTYEFYWTWDYGTSSKNVVASGVASETIPENDGGFFSKVVYYDSVTGNGQPDYGLDYGSVTVYAYNIEKPTITGPYYKDFSATSLHFSSNGGTQQIKYTKYYLKGGDEYNSTLESYSVSCEKNTSTLSKEWTETVGDKTITCTQDGAAPATYTFFYSNSATSGDTISGTQKITYDASGKNTGIYPPYIISSKSTDDGTTTIGYTGGPSAPGVNESEKQVVTTGSYVQNESGNTLDWEMTQEANKKTYYGSTSNDSDNPLSFESKGGTTTATMTTWWQWDTSTDKHDIKTYSCTVTRPENTSTQTLTGYETFTNDGVTVKVYYTQKPKSATSVKAFVGSYARGSSTGTAQVTATISTPVPFSVSVSGKVSATRNSGSSAEVSKSYSITIPANSSSEIATVQLGYSVDTSTYASTISSVSPTTNTVDGTVYTINYNSGL